MCIRDSLMSVSVVNLLFADQMLVEIPCLFCLFYIPIITFISVKSIKSLVFPLLSACLLYTSQPSLFRWLHHPPCGLDLPLLLHRLCRLGQGLTAQVDVYKRQGHLGRTILSVRPMWNRRAASGLSDEPGYG